MSGKIYPVEAKDMTKKQLRKAKRAEDREKERISNISEEYPEGWSGVHPCVNSCTKCGCAAAACGCGIAAGCTGGCTAFGGGRKTRRRKRGGGYIFGFYSIGNTRYLVKKKGPKFDEFITEDDGKIKLYDYLRVINNQDKDKEDSWYDKKYEEGGAFLRMHQPEGEKKGGRTRRRKRKRRRKSTKKKRRRKRTKKKRRRKRRRSRR